MAFWIRSGSLALPDSALFLKEELLDFFSNDLALDIITEMREKREVCAPGLSLN